jgi:cellulose synthase/poly-beta-1,6-N-acetylglucosamine synthase-like glycosyltransferase
MAIALACIYIAALSFIFFYSLSQFHLVVIYLRRRNRIAIPSPDFLSGNEETFPFVTIQLPIFNELYVTERLVDAVAAFDWPRSRMEIQLLDDSTDDTVEIAAKKVAEIKSKGISIAHIRRPDRTGFKAGALKYGMEIAKGEYFAIFDADFLPQPDFLRRTIPGFADEKVGVVQTRWEHLNENFSLLTRMQAFGLDGHFTVEQGGRNAGGYFLNFNGTAGVWRRKAIEEGGGWNSDTLTEDLDLSYRAQLKGWKIKFLEDIASPAELPVTMSAVKSQQFRWTKGAAENARKNIGNVWRAPMPFGRKVHALFHLSNSFIFVCLFTAAIVSLPLLVLKPGNDLVTSLLTFGFLFMFGTVFLSIFYGTSRRARNKIVGVKGWLGFIIGFPAFLAVSMGLSFHNCLATLQGYAGKKSPFIRTPKFNVKSIGDKWQQTIYAKSSIGILTALEGFLAILFFAAICYGISIGELGLIPFHLLLFAGFGFVFLTSLRHAIVTS